MNIPEWMVNAEHYTPLKDRDRFSDKSIRSLLGVLSRIKAQSVQSDFFQINTALRLFFSLLLILLLSLSHSFSFVLVVSVCLLAMISLLSAPAILAILKSSFGMATVSLIILLPSVLAGNRYSAVMITLKVATTAAIVSLLSRTSKWHSLTGALRRFFVPDLFILVLDITIKYLYLLGEFSVTMLYALRLRSIGKNRRKRSSVSGVAGSLFIKSREMAEDVYAAMECRGFAGEYRRFEKTRFKAADLLYTLLHAALVLLFFYFERA